MQSSLVNFLKLSCMYILAFRFVCAAISIFTFNEAWVSEFFVSITQ